MGFLSRNVRSVLEVEQAYPSTVQRVAPAMLDPAHLVYASLGLFRAAYDLIPPGSIRCVQIPNHIKRILGWPAPVGDDPYCEFNSPALEEQITSYVGVYLIMGVKYFFACSLNQKLQTGCGVCKQSFRRTDSNLTCGLAVASGITYIFTLPHGCP